MRASVTSEIDTTGLDFQHRQELVERLHELEGQRDAIQREIRNVTVRLQALKIKEGRNSNDVFARVFKNMAHRMLDEKTYLAVLVATQEKLGWAQRQIEGDDDD
jgi:hypothetical protein